MKPRAVVAAGNAFTLLEVITVIAVLVILGLMLTEPFSYIRERGNRVKCQGNLVQLYVAATAYMADHQAWPQISTEAVGKASYAEEWISVFSPYKISRAGWICPSIQLQLGNPIIGAANVARIDYLPTSFDSEPLSPSRYQTHPWFCERGNVHGDGNLIMFANGQIKSMSDVLRDINGQTMEW